METSRPELNIRLEITYATDLGEFKFLASEKVNIELALDINVHDIFTEHVLLSKFAIRPVSEVPLNLVAAELKGCESHKVEPSLGRWRPIVVFPNQHASVTYRITADRRHDKSKASVKQSLILTLHYRTLREDVSDTLERSFGEAIEEGPFAYLKRLLVPKLLEKVVGGITAREYEAAGLLGVLSLGNYEELAWEEDVDLLHPSIRGSTREWLKQWHLQTGSVRFSRPEMEEYGTRFPVRQIIVTIEAPGVPILHTATLRIAGEDDRRRWHDRTLEVGQVVAAEITIRHTRRWAAPGSSHQEADTPLDFVYEIQASPESWVIGGQRRARFSAKEEETTTFPVMLIPLRPGHLMIPLVDVKPQSEAYREDGKRRTADGSGITCETDYRDRAESVLVVRDIRSTTVSVDFAAPDVGGTQLLELESRTSSGVAPQGSTSVVPPS